jgi:hypothetical protein
MSTEEVIEVDGTKPGEGGEIDIEHPSLLVPEAPVKEDPHALKPFSDKLIQHVEEINSDYQDFNAKPMGQDTTVDIRESGVGDPGWGIDNIVSSAVNTGVVQQISNMADNDNDDFPANKNTSLRVDSLPDQEPINNLGSIYSGDIPPMPPQPK